MKNPASKQLDLFADTPRVVGPKDPRLDEALLLRELADTRREVRNLTVIGMRPDVSADQREIIRLLERSARARVKLGQQALQYCREQQRGQR
jgi:hypothetical protein